MEHVIRWLSVIAFTLILMVLAGCDFSEYERRVAQIEANARYVRDTVPQEHNEIVVLEWRTDKKGRRVLVAKRYVPEMKYGKKDPHITVRPKVVLTEAEVVQ